MMTSSRKQILLVDDDENFSRMLGNALKQRFQEADIQMFGDGAPAASWLNDNRPDLILTDVCLPSYGGLELILMAQALVPGTPIIVLSGTSLLDDIHDMTGDREGMRFYRKPFNLNEFLNDVESFLVAEPESTIRGLSPIMLIQVIQLERKTCRMDLTSGNAEGQLYFSNGALHYAHAGDVDGEIAFKAMMRWNYPTVNIHAGLGPPEINVQTPLEQLIQEMN
jgi:DNA-binding response OmpR family regulator